MGEMFFKVYKRPGDHANWKKQIEYAQLEAEHADLSDAWVLALKFLEQELGKGFLKACKRQHPIQGYALKDATLKYVNSLSLQIKHSESRGGYGFWTRIEGGETPKINWYGFGYTNGISAITAGLQFNMVVSDDYLYSISAGLMTNLSRGFTNYFSNMGKTFSNPGSLFTKEAIGESTANALTLGLYSLGKSSLRTGTNVQNGNWGALAQQGGEFLAEASVVAASEGLGQLKGVVSSSNTVGKIAFNSPIMGGKSFLFGRRRLGALDGKANGILNRNPNRRLGWSWNDELGRHEFQMRTGGMWNSDHARPWFIYKPN